MLGWAVTFYFRTSVLETLVELILFMPSEMTVECAGRLKVLQSATFGTLCMLVRK